MRRALLTLIFGLVACASADPSPLRAANDLPGLITQSDQIDAKTILSRAYVAAGGESFRRPRTLFMSGYGVFYENGRAIVHDRYEMRRVFPAWKGEAHAADGKVRIESWIKGERKFLTAFDGESTYSEKGRLPKSAADAQWAENFGFGVIRFAMDDGYQTRRLMDDLVDGVLCRMVEVTDPKGGKTLFWIAAEGDQIRKVGFKTQRGWHERIYSDFFSKPGLSWVQPGRVRLYYDGVKQNEIVWTDFRLNEAMSDDLFVVKADGAK